jgi:hypothetical protein
VSNQKQKEFSLLEAFWVFEQKKYWQTNQSSSIGKENFDSSF